MELQETVTAHQHELSPSHLLDLVDPKNPQLLEKMGGAQGLAEKLRTSLTEGLRSEASILASQRNTYGTNKLPEPVSSSFLQFVWEALHDQTLIILMVAAAVEMLIGIYKAVIATEKDTLALIDGGAIIVAIVIVVLIGAISDYRKQAQFRSLYEFGQTLKTVRVLRDGQVTEVQTDDILVGDIVEVQTGLIVPTDGVLFQCFSVTVDESTMTGEPMGVEKDLKHDPFLLSGTSVVNGVGKMMVIATGINSLNGRSLLALEVEAEETPLQMKLGRVADIIAKCALYLAVSMVVILVVIYFLSNLGNIPGGIIILQDMLMLFILAVTIVVVAVPEGLPLAVTLSLAHATLQMLKDNNLVRHLSACETMGNATTICSDKTGTLTLNKMTIVEAQLMNEKFTTDKHTEFVNTITKGSSVGARVLALVAKSLNVNSTAGNVRGKDGETTMQGSKTEIAILHFFEKMGFPYQKDRDECKILVITPFSSENKSMSCVVEESLEQEVAKLIGLPEGEDPSKAHLLFVKGASEIILRFCTKFMTADGNVVPLTDEHRAVYQKKIETYANEALRTISCAIKPISSTNEDEQTSYEDLILVGLFGIMDPLRPEVVAAVKDCQNAGIVVRMVTGDSIATAQAIGKSCGILHGDGIVMEGPAFRKLTVEEMREILPRLQVLARSSPLDKQILVKNLKAMGETVAVTGALASADVGFSMGIAGTEVCKEASDIILMDDNFASLVKAVVWGRCVFDAIRKFLQFQLTVNISAVAIAVISAIATTVGGDKKPESVLTAVQLLWVNLIMDTLAALALATDEPSPELLTRKPSKKSEPLVNSSMAVMIIGQAFYQMIVCLVVFFMGPIWFPKVVIEGAKQPFCGFVTATMVFNVFIFCQIFNEINCRSVSSEKNVFKGIIQNNVFIAIIIITVIGQALIVQFGNVVFGLDPNGLSAANWGISIAIGSGSLVVGFLIRLLPPVDIPASLLGGSISSDEGSATIVVAGTDHKSEAALIRTLSASSQQRWQDAINKTRMQVRVVKIFMLPQDALGPRPRASDSLLNMQTPEGADTSRPPSHGGWERLRMYILTASVFRHTARRDHSSTQMVDPRIMRASRINAAKSSAKSRNE